MPNLAFEWQRPYKRLQMTAFGARDRASFDTWYLLYCCLALAGRQLKREALGRCGTNSEQHIRLII